MRAGKIIELYQPERQTRSRTQRDIMQARYEEAMNWCHITLDAAIALGIVAFAETVLLVFYKIKRTFGSRQDPNAQRLTD